MAKKNIQEFYVSPEVEMVEIKARKMLCQSEQSASNSGYESMDYEW